MIKIDNVETYGWEAAIRGMRNPMNSWDKSDSLFYFDHEYHDILGNTGPSYGDDREDDIGINDMNLMRSLAKSGPVHAKFRRMLTITMDIIAPLYWWKEFDTYKVGTVANSCSTMHKIQAKPFVLDDFSHEHLIEYDPDDDSIDLNDKDVRDGYCSLGVSGADVAFSPSGVLELIIAMLNRARDLFLETNDRLYWWQMIQLLPSSYNQKRTVQLNYEVAHNIYISRKDHKLDEWHTLCNELAKLPMSELITRE